MEEESLKNFINSIIFLVKLFSGLKDKFLAQKLYDKISGFIAGYIQLFNSKGEDGKIVSRNSLFATSDEITKLRNIVRHDYVSHNVASIELKNTLNGLLELLDYLEHSKLVSTTPLLYARRNLLDLKLDLIRFQRQLIQPASKSKENAIITTPQHVQPRNLRKDSSNKDKIFNFIKRSPNSRTKEIIEEFSILSERTVKRNLKELITQGLVRKLAKDSGVYYSVISL